MHHAIPQPASVQAMFARFRQFCKHAPFQLPKFFTSLHMRQATASTQQLAVGSPKVASKQQHPTPSSGYPQAVSDPREVTDENARESLQFSI
mmetsp:Transcript_59685/g.108851  ORF Transcript_59685/g.108851 Transcript_59685/m.108851 type:complete len:92 (-) Transcript_59685:56-331(-)